MNRSMDKIRILRGILLLSNVLIIFLPAVSIWQENYPEQVYSQYSFIQGYLISGTGAGAAPASGFTRFMTVLLVVLPLLLAVFAGVCFLVERLYREYVPLVGLAAFLLYLFQLFFGAITLWPKRINEAQQYRRGMGTWLLLIVVYGLLAAYIIPFFSQKLRKKAAAAEEQYVPVRANEQAARQPVEMPPLHRGAASDPNYVDSDSVSYTQTDQVRLRGNGTENHTLTQTQTEIHLSMEKPGLSVQSIPGNIDMALPPRGVMVGVSGIFAGKEIAFKDGETLHLGREFTNDLVFTNASHISRNHCSITWNAQKQKYYVVDESSNGCFINGSFARIPGNVEIALEPGTLIDIGDQTNRFRLE